MRPIEWRNHVQDWQKSGLSKRAYAREHSLSYSQLLYWTNKPEFKQTPAELLVPINIVPESTCGQRLGTIEFTNGTQLHIHDGALLTDIVPLLLR